MTRRWFNLVAIVILGLLGVTQPGCLLLLAAGATGGTVAYVRGDLETSIDAPAKDVADATERAMKAMDISVLSNQATALDATVVGRTARDVKLTVVVKAETDKLSRVSVRAGVFGDDAMQDRLMEKIREELAQPKTASTDAQ